MLALNVFNCIVPLRLRFQHPCLSRLPIAIPRPWFSVCFITIKAESHASALFTLASGHLALEESGGLDKERAAATSSSRTGSSLGLDGEVECATNESTI